MGEGCLREHATGSALYESIRQAGIAAPTLLNVSSTNLARSREDGFLDPYHI
jgi:hypothetical protein